MNFKNIKTLNTDSKIYYILNSRAFTLFIIFIFYLMKISSSFIFYFNDTRLLFEIPNSFGGYIESIVNGNGFKSCIFDNHFTIFKNDYVDCNYSTRMPVIPFFYAFIAYLISNKIFFIAIVKNSLITLIFTSFIFVYLKIYQKKFNDLYLTNIALLIIFLSPVIIKHASNITYEEGITLEMLILWMLFFLLALRLFKKKLYDYEKIVPIVLICISTLLYLTKETMLFVLVISLVTSLLWIKKKFNYKILLSLALSLFLIFGWGVRNYQTTNKFSLGTSINWMLTYYGFNDTAYKIYPEIALDQLFFSKKFFLKNGTVVKNQENFKTVFDDEWVRNKYYKDRIFSWILENPVKTIKFSFKKTYYFLISIKKTPYSIGPDVNQEYFKNKTQEISISIWLLIGRLFTVLLIYQIIIKFKENKFLCSSIIFVCICYAAPYIIAFNYERHTTPFLAMVILSSMTLWNKNTNYK